MTQAKLTGFSLHLTSSHPTTSTATAVCSKLHYLDSPQRSYTLSPTRSQDYTNMPEPKTSTGLLTLPPELRNRIYEYVVRPGEDEGGVTGEQAICVHNAPNYCDATAATHHGRLTTWRVQPALTRVCRQTRNEALQIYYWANTFVDYVSGEYDFDGIAGWAWDIGKVNAARVNQLSLRFKDGCHDVDVPCEDWVELGKAGIRLRSMAIVHED